ncbi:MAG: SH3 domain-containing protein [Burkholderiales bacterium]|nr:SH3 domain-containing protein [Anaerolineae bacterium]
MKTRLLFLCTAILLVMFILSERVVPVSAEQVSAQETGTCPALLEDALAQMNSNCGSMGTNSVCYGYRDVVATFSEPMPDDFFDQPADLAPLETLASLQTTQFNSEQNQWGVAMLKLRANLPNTLPGQSVIFVLMGDVSLENAVPIDEAFIPPDPLPILSTGSANIRSGPGTNWNVIGSAAAGSELLADGFSADQNWMRVQVDDRYGWVNRALLDLSAPQVEGLPVIDYERRVPMQAFTFQAGIGQPICGQAPNQLLVQGPRDTLIDLNVNGVDVTIGSTVSFRQPAQDQMQLMVLEGNAYVNGDQHIPEGFSAVAPVLIDDGGTDAPTSAGGGDDDDDGGLNQSGSDDAEWSQIRPMSSDELSSAQALEAFSDDVLNYSVDVPDEPVDPSDVDNENGADGLDSDDDFDDADDDSIDDSSEDTVDDIGDDGSDESIDDGADDGGGNDDSGDNGGDE